MKITLKKEKALDNFRAKLIKLRGGLAEIQNKIVDAVCAEMVEDLKSYIANNMPAWKGLYRNEYANLENIQAESASGD